jgi:hypothetical protein
MNRRVVLLLISVLGGSSLVAGCGGEFRRGAETAPSDFKSASAKIEPQSLTAARNRAIESGGGAAGVPNAAQLPSDKSVERKIIYTVSLELAVTQFDGVQEQVERLVREQPGAYVSEATLSGVKGSHRTGQWTIRVPQEKYDTFTAALRTLGEVTSENKKSDEVTEEFYDLSARIKNKKETEKRLLKIQEALTGELDQVLAAEREVARVREEIERLEGQLNRLDNLTSLTTIKLSVAEIVTYQGEQPLAFTGRVSGAWSDSLMGLRQFGEGLAIFLVALAPWLPIWILVGFGIRFFYRRMLPRNAPPALPVAPPPVPAA